MSVHNEVHNEAHDGTHGEPPAQRGIWLIPACRYTQAGLVSLAAACGAVVDVLEQSADLINRSLSDYPRVVCDLSGDLAGCLSRVALLGRVLSQGTPAVVITPGLPPSWLYGTLRYLAGPLPDLRVMTGRASLADMTLLAAGALPQDSPRLLEALPAPTRGLSRRELEVLQAVLGGESVRAMAARTGLTAGTLHAHRHNGLYELEMLRRMNAWGGRT